MKMNFRDFRLATVGVLAMGLFGFHYARAQGTAFMYQGRLKTNGSAADGIYDLRFKLYDALTNGAAVSDAITNLTTRVENGLFTVSLDFGAGVFSGAERWL